MPDATLQDLADELTASRHAGGYRFKVPERVLRQFAGYCRREGYPDGSITREAVDGFLYGRHLRASTVRRNELALWITPGTLEAIEPGRMQGHGGAEEIPRGAARARGEDGPGNPGARG